MLRKHVYTGQQRKCVSKQVSRMMHLSAFDAPPSQHCPPVTGRTCTSSLSAADCLRMSSRSHPRHWGDRQAQCRHNEGKSGKQAERRPAGRQHTGRRAAGRERERTVRWAGVQARMSACRDPYSSIQSVCCFTVSCVAGGYLTHPAGRQLSHVSILHPCFHSMNLHTAMHALPACSVIAKLLHILKPAWLTHPLCVVVQIQGLPG